MPVTLAGFADRMAAAPAVLKGAERRMVNAAALTITGALRAELSAATKGSNRLSGVGRSGVKLSVGFDVKGSDNPTALVRARGAWQLIESNTAAHRIAPRKRRRGGTGSALALAGNGFGPVAAVNHPGTKGKHPWVKGVAAGVGPATLAAAAEARAGIAKAFLG